MNRHTMPLLSIICHNRYKGRLLASSIVRLIEKQIITWRLQSTVVLCVGWNSIAFLRMHCTVRLWVHSRKCRGHNFGSIFIKSAELVTDLYVVRLITRYWLNETLIALFGLFVVPWSNIKIGIQHDAAISFLLFQSYLVASKNCNLWDFDS